LYRFPEHNANDGGDVAARVEFVGGHRTSVPKDKMRFSYGGGVRFALGKATIARVDVGFSDEEMGLVYLVFGHTF
jgi:alpha-D-ribose 1-methylphosphonate 5-triphosphate synthase subunit PhnG